MSALFRPVKEVWGDHSDEFISVAALGDLLTSIAEEIESEYEQNPYSDMEVFWIQDGHAFLHYIEDETRFNVLRVRELLPDEDEDSIQSLIGNMRNLVQKWRLFIDGTDGSLRFYMD